MKNSRRTELLCADSGIVFIVMMFAALITAGWLPPPAPSLGAQEVANMYLENTTRIRIGALIMMFACVFYWSFSTAIKQQMIRIEGDIHPLADLQLVLSTPTAMALMIPSFLWLVAAYRLDISPEITRALNDIGFMMFVGAIPPAVLQYIAIGVCVLSKNNQAKVLPRWYGFYILWIAAGTFVGIFIAFFKQGPLAWNGMLAFWFAAVFFGMFFIGTWIVLRRAIKSGSKVPE